MLSRSDKENILRDFPNIKLSYENITHKKVYNSDYIVAIPEGKSCFAWFTYFNDKPVCLIMELTNNKEISDIKITSACFSYDLAYGTILYGKVVYNSSNRFFFIEDIFCYKGNLTDREKWGEKLTLINNIFKNDLKQLSYNNSFIVFGLPLMSKTNEELEVKISNANYKIEKIQYYLFNRVNNYLFLYYKNFTQCKITNNNDLLEVSKDKIICKTTLQNPIKRENTSKQELIQEIVFLVRPDIQDDIYDLYYLNNELKEERYSIAHIPNFDTSVMMNKLFRIIKENDNLDALEESDDEEEFENDNIDKFVKLDKSYKMICKFNYKFKKWFPIKLAKDESKIITIDQLKNIYKFYEQNRKR